MHGAAGTHSGCQYSLAGGSCLVTITVTVTEHGSESGSWGAGMSSVRQIAQRMRVSVATVSRALNNQPEISPTTRDKILKAANELGYYGAVGKRVTTNVGLVFTSDIPFTEFDGLLVGGMVRGLGEQRFDLAIISLERDKSDGESYTQFFMRKGLRGAVLRTDTHSRHICEEIA